MQWVWKVVSGYLDVWMGREILIRVSISGCYRLNVGSRGYERGYMRILAGTDEYKWV